MKRKLAMLLVFCMVAGTVSGPAGMLEVKAAEVQEAGTNGTEQDNENNYECWEQTDGTVKITKYKGSGTEVVIPSEIGGKTVTIIGSFAFRDCSSMESVVVPKGIEEIGSYAFSGCSNLNSVEISDSVTSIEASAFQNCSSLRSIVIPSSVTVISESTFYNCSSLKNIRIPNRVTSIGSGAFYGCNSLESIQIPDSVRYIGSQTFGGCTNLSSIRIPKNITSIADQTFWNCDALTSIEIPDGVTSIGARAFSSCGGLKSITIPESVVSIEQTAFESVYSLTVYCAEGSYAETYSQKKGFTTKDISEAPTEEPGASGGNQPGENEGGNTGTPGGEQQGPTKPVEKAEQTILAEDVEKTMGDTPFSLSAETSGDGALSYQSKNPEIVTVDEAGTVTLVSAGTAQITITASETNSYKAARKIVTVAVIPEGYTPIHDISELSAIRNNPSGNYILMNDIDMSSTREGGDDDCGRGWDSIEIFRGILDGNGHRIVGMHIFGEFKGGEYIGLFERYSRTIRNLGMIDCEINVITGTGSTKIEIGTIAGDGDTIENCYSSGKITIQGSDVPCWVGGLTGYGNTIFKNCYNSCNIDCSQTEAEYYIGGICGYCYRLENCYNTGKVDGNEKSQIGALGGYHYSNYSNYSNLSYLKDTIKRGGKIINQGIGSEQDNASCVVRTESQMKNQNYFTGFDFTDIWEIDSKCESYPYPQLRNNRMIKVTSIELMSAPTKLVYNQGESLKFNDGLLKITYEDGISPIHPLELNMLSGYDMTKIGKQEVLISYGNAETSFEIEVKEIPVTGITVSQSTLSLYRAKEQQLSAAIAPANATDKSVAWESDNSNVARVSSDGWVKAMEKGTATITATSSNGLQSKCIVTVLVPAISVKLSQDAITLKEGGRTTITAQISPLDSTDTVQWKSSNPGVAEVYEGTVIAKSAGTATVSAYTESGAHAECAVTVQKATNSGNNNQNSGNSNQNSSGNGQSSGGKLTQTLTCTKIYNKTYGNKPFQLDAKVKTKNGTLTYTSSAPKVVTVTGTGKATIKGTGIAIITVRAKATATYQEATAQITVRVMPAKQEVKSVKAQKGKKLKISWKKDTKASGYQIQCSTDRTFKKEKKMITVTKNRTISKTVSKLKIGKQYYVRVRSYKNVKVNGKTQKLYGAWSSIKRSGKVKK